VVPGRVGPVQAKGAGNAFPLPSGFRLRAGGGLPLPSAVQAHLEGVFGASFGDVRVHLGGEAARIGALAFTHGTDLYFAPGQYQPHTAHGLHLLGHELAHVVQQRSGRVRNPLGAGLAVIRDPAMEAEADRMGQRAARQPVAGPAGLIQARNPVPPPRVPNSAVGRARPEWADWPIRVPPVVQRKPGGGVQCSRVTNFDATRYSAGLNPAYAPTQTHFTYLDDNEIQGGGAWLAQPGENLHITFQNTGHTVVAHYFYHRANNTWRRHQYGGAPRPYGADTDGNLVALQQRAIHFAWPPGNVTEVTLEEVNRDKQTAKTAEKQKREEAKRRKHKKTQKWQDELKADDVERRKAELERKQQEDVAEKARLAREAEEAERKVAKAQEEEEERKRRAAERRARDQEAKAKREAERKERARQEEEKQRQNREAKDARKREQQRKEKERAEQKERERQEQMRKEQEERDRLRREEIRSARRAGEKLHKAAAKQVAAEFHERYPLPLHDYSDSYLG
jgi:hypothetical protein